MASCLVRWCDGRPLPRWWSEPLLLCDSACPAYHNRARCAAALCRFALLLHKQQGALPRGLRTACVVQTPTPPHTYLLLLMKNTASLAAKMRALARMAVSTACSSPSGPSSSSAAAGPCGGVEAVKPAAADAAATGGLM